jgi:hypothetical protein
LREEEPIWSLLYKDSQEVMEGYEILHGELPLEGRYEVMQSVVLDDVRAMSSI